MIQNVPMMGVNECSKRKRTSYSIAVTDETKALALSYEISICTLLVRGLPWISLAVHDTPRAIYVAPVVP